MGGWMDGWMEGKAGLRIAYSNQKLVCFEFEMVFCINDCDIFQLILSLLQGYQDLLNLV
jgi:hypothetical protein